MRNENATPVPVSSPELGLVIWEVLGESWGELGAMTTVGTCSGCCGPGESPGLYFLKSLFYSCVLFLIEPSSLFSPVLHLLWQLPLVKDRSAELLYFADVCAGPGGFSEYVLWRKKWHAKGFGMTLKGPNDFKLEDFYSASSELFEPYYGRDSGQGGVRRCGTACGWVMLRWRAMCSFPGLAAGGPPSLS